MASKVRDEALEAVGKVLEPVGKALEPVEKALEPVIGQFWPILFASKARSYNLVHGFFLPAR
jgi:hypothetical protein